MHQMLIVAFRALNVVRYRKLSQLLGVSDISRHRKACVTKNKNGE